MNLYFFICMGLDGCGSVSMGTCGGLSVETHVVLSIDVEFTMYGKGLGRELLGSSVVMCVYGSSLCVDSLCVSGSLTLYICLSVSVSLKCFITSLETSFISFYPSTKPYKDFLASLLSFIKKKHEMRSTAKAPSTQH